MKVITDLILWGWRKSNCLFFVIRKFRENQGSYIVFRWTWWNRLKWLRWPHFLWMPNKCPEKGIPCPYFLSFNPVGDKIKRLIPPIVFIGKESEGDEDNNR